MCASEKVYVPERIRGRESEGLHIFLVYERERDSICMHKTERKCERERERARAYERENMCEEKRVFLKGE